MVRVGMRQVSPPIMRAQNTSSCIDKHTGISSLVDCLQLHWCELGEHKFPPQQRENVSMYIARLVAMRAYSIQLLH